MRRSRAASTGSAWCCQSAGYRSSRCGGGGGGGAGGGGGGAPPPPGGDQSGKTSDTKRHAEDIAQWCEARVAVDTPVNIHLTGCHHSCAQHYIGDIGLLACKVEASEDGDQVEGYHVHIGGGFGPDAVLAREIFRDVPAPEAPKTIERMLKAYLANRAAPDETVLAFSRRHEVEQLKAMVEAEGAE